MADANHPDSKDNSGEKGGRDRDENGQRLVPASEISRIVSERVAEVTAKATREKAELTARLDALETTAKKPATVTYTREQLGAAVTDGKLTQQQANAIWDRQQEALITKTAADTATKIVNGASRGNELQSKIDKYVAKYPDLLKDGSELRQRVAAEVRVQQEEFGKTGLEAEYAALRQELGKESALQFNTEEHDRQGHQDTLGGGGADESRPASKDGFPKDMPAHYRAHYKSLLDKGIYKDMSAVTAEWKHANPNVVKKSAALARMRA